MISYASLLLNTLKYRHNSLTIYKIQNLIVDNDFVDRPISQDITMATSRIVLITGANAGLGLEIAKALTGSKAHYTIIVAGRSSEKVSAAIETVKALHPHTKSNLAPLTLDIESDESISKAASFVEETYGHLDVLINNAGAQHEGQLANGPNKLTPREAFNKDWDVNVTGTHLLTHALAPILVKSSKPYLLFMTSGTCSLTETEDSKLYFNKAVPAGFPKPPAIPAYRSCKTGLNMIMREWSRWLKNDGVLVWAVSPGFLATGLGGDADKLKRMGALDPSVGGAFVKDVVEGKREADAGKVIRATSVQPW